MKTLTAALVAAALVAALPASAQTLDLSKVKCKEFVDSGPEKMTLIVTWLYGFNTDEDDPPIIDFDQIKVYVDKIRAFCTQNPTFGLQAAAEEIMQ